MSRGTPAAIASGTRSGAGRWRHDQNSQHRERRDWDEQLQRLGDWKILLAVEGERPQHGERHRGSAVVESGIGVGGLCQHHRHPPQPQEQRHEIGADPPCRKHTRAAREAEPPAQRNEIGDHRQEHGRVVRVQGQSGSDHIEAEPQPLLACGGRFGGSSARPAFGFSPAAEEEDQSEHREAADAAEERVGSIFLAVGDQWRRGRGQGCSHEPDRAAHGDAAYREHQGNGEQSEERRQQPESELIVAEGEPQPLEREEQGWAVLVRRGISPNPH